MVKSLPSKAGGVGLIPSWGAKTPHALGPKNRNMKQKQYCIDTFEKTLKMAPHKVLKKKRSKERERMLSEHLIIFSNLLFPNLLNIYRLLVMQI